MTKSKIKLYIILSCVFIGAFAFNYTYPKNNYSTGYDYMVIYWEYFNYSNSNVTEIIIAINASKNLNSVVVGFGDMPTNIFTTDLLGVQILP